MSAEQQNNEEVTIDLRRLFILIVGMSSNRDGIDANFPEFYNSSKMADSFSASHFCFMHDFLEMQGSQL